MDAHHIYECTSVPHVDEVVLTINGKTHLIKSPDPIISVKVTLTGSPDNADTRSVHMKEEAAFPTYPEESIDRTLALNQEIQDILDDILRTTAANLQATHDVNASTYLFEGATQDDMQAFQEHRRSVMLHECQTIQEIKEAMWEESHMMMVEKHGRVRQQILQGDGLADEELQSSSTPSSFSLPNQTTSPR